MGKGVTYGIMGKLKASALQSPHSAWIMASHSNIDGAHHQHFL